MNEKALENNVEAEMKEDIYYLGRKWIQIAAAAICFIVTAALVGWAVIEWYMIPIEFTLLTLAVLEFISILLTFMKKSRAFLIAPTGIVVLIDLAWIMIFIEMEMVFPLFWLVLSSITAIICYIRYCQNKPRTRNPMIVALIIRDLVLYGYILIAIYTSSGFLGGWETTKLMAVILLPFIFFKLSVILTIINIKHKQTGLIEEVISEEQVSEGVEGEAELSH